MASSNKSKRTGGHRNKRSNKGKPSDNAESTTKNKKSRTNNGQNRSVGKRESENDYVDHEERSVDLLVENEEERGTRVLNTPHGKRRLPHSVRERLAIARQEETRLTENQKENCASDDSESESAEESQKTNTSGDATKGKGEAAQMEMFNIQKYVRQTIFCKKKLYLKSPKWKWEGNFSMPS